MQKQSEANKKYSLSPEKNKVTVFPKENMSDLVYGAQNRLFKHLHKQGLVLPESVQAGSFFGSIEGTMEKSIDPDASAAKMTLIKIHEFIEEERPYFEQAEAVVSMNDDHMLEPDKEYSTELGEVPQRTTQGSMYIRDPYAMNYMYTMQEKSHVKEYEINNGKLGQLSKRRR